MFKPKTSIIKQDNKQLNKHENISDIELYSPLIMSASSTPSLASTFNDASSPSIIITPMLMPRHKKIIVTKKRVRFVLIKVLISLTLKDLDIPNSLYAN